MKNAILAAALASALVPASAFAQSPSASGGGFVAKASVGNTFEVEKAKLAFDKIYIADQVAAHAETVALLSDCKQNGKNGDLPSWTKDVPPVVKRHQADITAM